MPVSDRLGNQLLEVMPLDEAALLELEPLTHAVVIARRGGRTLLVFSRHKQHWELPGGHVDVGETARACAVRELREESGLVCEPSALRCAAAIKIRTPRDGNHAGADVHYGALYLVDVDRIDPFVPNDEISAVMWWDGVDAIAEISPIDDALIRNAR